MDSPVPLMYHDPDRSRITDPDPDHPKGTQPLSYFFQLHISKGATKVPAVNLLRLNTLKGIKGVLLGVLIPLGVLKLPF